MLIAGEASGDLLAAELVSALRGQLYALDPDLRPDFFGAGGPRMAEADVKIAVEMTQHAVIGISDVLKNYFKFRRLFNQLLALAIATQTGCRHRRGFRRVQPALRAGGQEICPRQSVLEMESENRPVRFAAGLGIASGPGGFAGGGLRFALEHLSV